MSTTNGNPPHVPVPPQKPITYPPPPKPTK